jgi:carboxyl-terminal processing protease
MRIRVPACSLQSVWSAFSLLVAFQSATLFGQTFVPPTMPSVERVSIAAESLPSIINGLLEEGRSLELSGRWADALSHYEEALHVHPQEPALQARFDNARLHYSLEQRYDDRSFRDSLRTLRPSQALDQYSDLLAKIEAHYYTTPPWQDICRRGTTALDIALANESFLRDQGVRVRGQQVDQLRAEIVQLPNRYMIRSARDASAVASQAARIARQRIGLSETATVLEFTAAAAGGLDHYSAFLTADQLRDIYSQIEGNFVGLGVELKADNGALLIVDVIPRSPAEQAGIRENDRITAVDGQPTATLSTDEAASLLTGAEGSLVRVTIVSPGQPPRDITVRRASIEVPSLEDVKILDPATGVAYVRIPAFQKTTAADLEEALWDLHRQGMRSLIIDLRGNPGGLLTASVEVADKFIADGGIVSTRGRSEQENFSYRAHRPGTWRVPLVVLIDGDSASASEIFAAAIKDAGRGKIVGMRSYGKGSVQGIFPLGKNGAGARLTTARFFSPLGHPISNVGVTPDIDARRATSMAAEEQAGPHLVSFGPKDANDRSATNIDPAADHAADGGARGMSVTVNNIGASSRDEVLDIAVEVARVQPVAAL